MDLVFNALSCLLIFYILADRQAGVGEASSLLVLYVFYVGLISLVGNGWIPPMLAKDRAAWRQRKEAAAGTHSMQHQPLCLRLPCSVAVVSCVSTRLQRR